MADDTMARWPASVASKPILIDERDAIEVRDVLARIDLEMRAGPQDIHFQQQGNGARYTVIDGVAMIPISGVLINRGEYFGDGSYATSYPALTREINRAAADPSIRGIALLVNSPGGAADGILAPAQAIRDAKAVKPVIGIVGSVAASGGYWLIAQADEIVLQDDFSRVGSIGVYTMHIDYSKMLDDAGIAVTVISSGKNKVDGHPFAALPASVRKDMQEEVDDLRLVFAREVAAGRSALSVEAALATEARVFSAFNPRTQGRPAIEEKLADRMGSLSDVVGSLKRGRSPGSNIRITGMTDVTKEVHDKAVADAKAEGQAAGAAAAAARISGIMTSDEGKANPKLAEHFAYGTTDSVEKAKAALIAAGPAVAAPAKDEPKPQGQQTQSYQQRKAEAGAEGFVEGGQNDKKVAGNWGKATAAANKQLGPRAIN